MFEIFKLHHPPFPLTVWDKFLVTFSTTFKTINGTTCSRASVTVYKLKYIFLIQFTPAV